MFHFIRILIPMAIVSGVALPSMAATTRPSTPFVDFQSSAYFEERIKSYRFEPQVKIHINVPAAAAFDLDKPTHLILFALPNGNTTAQTIGKKLAKNVDWHYDIQHIGAQTRRLREVIHDYNIVVAYLEAEGRSWPTWKAKHADYRTLTPKVVDSIVKQINIPGVTIDLSGHSGGGSFIFGYIDSVERIPATIKRISFLDSNYGYNDDEHKHGDKLIAWLKRSPDHHLCVLCYDDRNIELDGKRVVGPQGGTWRATQRILDRFKKDIELTSKDTKDYTRLTGMRGQIDIMMHPNPQNKILHTALVGSMSGFIHSQTTGTPYENKGGIFNGPVTYQRWIQDDD